MGLVFAGQTNALEGEAGADRWPWWHPRPRPAAPGGVRVAGCWCLTLQRLQRFVCVRHCFVHVARLFSAVTFGLIED